MLEWLSRMDASPPTSRSKFGAEKGKKDRSNTHPEPDQRILLEQLKLTLPAQPPPRISSRRKLLVLEQK
jgi:hypothetical protein